MAYKTVDQLLTNVIEKIRPPRLHSQHHDVELICYAWKSIAEKHDLTFIRNLGLGGFAYVALARSEKLREPVAVKIALESPEYENGQRFRREVLLTELCSGENIVKLYSYGETEKNALYAILTGAQLGDLRNFDLSKLNPIDFAARVMLPCANALRHTESNKVVHKDIKPGNIFADSNFGLYLGDFGLAMSIDEIAVDDSGNVEGTPDYFSPEQARGDKVDHRSDIYSLGLTFFYLLTNSSFYSSLPNTLNQLAASIAGDRIDKMDLRDLRPDLDDSIIQIVEKMIQFDKNDRYESSFELVRHIEGYIAKNGAPVPVNK